MEAARLEVNRSTDALNRAKAELDRIREQAKRFSPMVGNANGPALQIAEAAISAAQAQLIVIQQRYAALAQQVASLEVAWQQQQILVDKLKAQTQTSLLSLQNQMDSSQLASRDVSLGIADNATAVYLVEEDSLSKDKMLLGSRITLLEVMLAN